ncbi:TPA: hypothetical protein JBE16_15750 [Legionella pneumophila subsp. pneumophila]|uniref:hypothetical protein n=1 Tax=Legionella sp. PATHC039 TaxID=2992042 RepID=UPI001A1ED0D9|nr:hypothetical protein [Legionella sp. PATHC039]MCW8394324.1 hypothetical protein [Legionella sp. PATHC039]HAT8860266.1 hypothetical protein [Legionella pneumophila subsp. pneumophila]HAT9652226.1 hypothetical protein [Legionella pneumophila subsp. pneumophila]HAT9921610.1 hypothetical protein [Legionella pneumophila subsp. pneumophila]
MPDKKRIQRREIRNNSLILNVFHIIILSKKGCKYEIYQRVRGILSQQLNWHKSREDCFAQMLLALFMVRSVNLSEIAVAMDGTKASIDSRYKRIYRFFSTFELDFIWIARWIYSLFFNSHQKIYNAIDRTNWYWGKAKINVFGVLCRKVRNFPDYPYNTLLV